LPATSKAQARFMNAIAHNPGFAKKAGVSQAMGKEFSASGGRYESLPERKGGEVSKKKGWIKGSKGEKTLKAKLAEPPRRKTEDERMSARYGGK